MRLPIDLNVGDLLAMSGTSLVSKVIAHATDSPRNLISHVAVMISPSLLAEATTLNGENGVTLINLEYKLSSYPGAIYAMPIKKEFSGKLDRSKFIDGIVAKDGMPYSKLQAILSPFHAGDDLHNWASSWYCSKLAAEAYKEGGLVPPGANTAVTPSGLTKWPIFDQLVLLKDKTNVVK